MRFSRLLWTAGGALMIGAIAFPAASQPKAEERKERREERREERKENREERREDRKENRDERKENREERREDRKEDREERRERMKKRHEERKETRKERRQERRKKLLEKYPKLAKHAAAVAEMKVHARRMARLNRAREVAEAEGRDEVVAKIDELIAKENARHQRVMAQHEDKIK